MYKIKNKNYHTVGKVSKFNEKLYKHRQNRYP